ncbi:phage tail tape measure protein [Rosenbergiella epipactidis]|uniref:phage tail tape measure protein n=1 Tax=Rosenbergiella epipactidis TaxID=1544694 RepID=UPI001F4E398E|nr:phage tail tape measure protein [Rosenbergiella epipactidis]
MAEQTSCLAVIIDSSGAQKNTETLASSLAKLTQAGQKAADGAGKVTRATQEESESLHQLLARIDPVNAALNKLDQQQQQLAKFKSKGFLDEDDFDLYSKKIDAARDHLTGMSDQLLKTGQSSKQAAWAMRMIPAQMTDIVVGLSTGQSPFMVLMQQGGQLKDMFGGIGPAIKGVGGYVMGLVNPFTLGAAAVGTLGLAYYQGQQEEEAFQQSLILTGNQVGKTAGQLSDMARNVSLATGSTQGAAADVLNQLVSAGNIAGDSLQKVAGSIVNMSNITGQATTQMVSDFESIAENPVQAISKLNDQYHFLTLATYNQIKALADEGNQQDAAKVATDTYANAVNSRAKDISNNLNALGQTWSFVAKQALGAWDAMEGIGRKDTIQDQISKVQSEINELSNPTVSIRFMAGADAKRLDALKKQLSILQGQATTENTLNDIISKHDQQQQDGIKAQQFINNLQDQSLSNAQKRTKEQNQLTEALKKTRAAGIVISASEEATLRQNIDDKYKDPSQPKQSQGRAYSEDAGTKLIDQLNQQHAALVAQVDATQKLGSAQQELVKWQTKLDGLTKKQNLTTDEKSLLANQNKITSLYKANALEEQTQQAKAEAKKIFDYQTQLDQQLQTARNANSAKFAGLGMGDLEAGRIKYLQDLQNKQDSDSQALLDKRDRGDLTESGYQSELASLKSYYQQRAQIAHDGFALEDSYRQDWQKGFMSGLQNSVDASSDMYSQMASLAQTTYSGMASSLANFVVTGKANFKDFTRSVIADLAQIEAKRALAGLATSLIPSLATSAIIPGSISGASIGGSGALGLSTSYTSYLQGGYDGGGFTGEGGKYDPAGIVHKGEFVFTKEATSRIGKDNLAKLMKGYSSGGYVGAPTAPLSSKRQQSGESGVVINGGINVNIDSNGKASATSTADGQGIAKQIQSAVVNTINEQATKQGTPLWRAIKGR